MSIIQIQPWIGNEELEQLKRVIDSTFVVENKLTSEFEDMTAKLTGAKHCIAMTNGTVAIYCGLKALNIGPGDEVIIPDLTFIATANAVIMAGATPIFCDVDQKTFCLCPIKTEKLINKKTKAIMPVHLYGQSADMTSINKLAKKYKLFVIEDAAQGVGVFFDNRHVGTFGDVGILSYYGNKTITCGEGGMILTNCDEIAKECYMLKNHGRLQKGVFVHEKIGFNFSFTEMQAAVGIAQMNKLNKIIQKKKEIYQLYQDKLSDIDKIIWPHIDNNCSPVHWFSSILLSKKDLVGLSKFLNEKNIQTRRFFYPLHLQPCFEYMNLKNASFKNSKDIFEKGLSLPSSVIMTLIEQKQVIKFIREYFG